MGADTVEGRVGLRFLPEAEITAAVEICNVRRWWYEL